MQPPSAPAREKPFPVPVGMAGKVSRKLGMFSGGVRTDDGGCPSLLISII